MVKFSESREPKRKQAFPRIFNRGDRRRQSKEDLRKRGERIEADVKHVGRVTKSTKKGWNPDADQVPLPE